MNVKVGSAPDSWGVWFADDPRQTPWERFLDEVAESDLMGAGELRVGGLIWRNWRLPVSARGFE